MELEQIYLQMLEKKCSSKTEKKMDPVGKADADIDNDGDVDSSDEYLHNRRKAIKKAMKEEDELDERLERDGPNKGKLNFNIPKSKAAQKYSSNKASQRSDMNKKNDPGAEKKGLALSVLDKKKAMDKAKKKGMNPSPYATVVGKKGMKEELDQIDEISKETLHSYRRKANDDRTTASNERIKNNTGDYSREMKRDKGLARSTAALNKKVKAGETSPNTKDNYSLKSTMALANKLKASRKEEVEIEESHFDKGEMVKCKASGMKGKVVAVDPKETGKYYTVKRNDGTTMKYSPNELQSLKEATSDIIQKLNKAKKELETKKELDITDSSSESNMPNPYDKKQDNKSHMLADMEKDDTLTKARGDSTKVADKVGGRSGKRHNDNMQGDSLQKIKDPAGSSVVTAESKTLRGFMSKNNMLEYAGGPSPEEMQKASKKLRRRTQTESEEQNEDVDMHQKAAAYHASKAKPVGNKWPKNAEKHDHAAKSHQHVINMHKKFGSDYSGTKNAVKTAKKASSNISEDIDMPSFSEIYDLYKEATLNGNVEVASNALNIMQDYLRVEGKMGNLDKMGYKSMKKDFLKK